MVRPHDSDRPSRSLFALRWVVVGIAIAFLARALLVQVYVVPSASMTPALQPSDRVLVEKLTGAWRTPARGDIVVFDATDVWTPDTDHLLVAKRVVAIAGDHIMCCDSNGRVILNGEAVDESFARGRSRSFDVKVPDGRLWVLGDDRAHSSDSAAQLAAPGGGSVPVDHVVGRALAVVWPLSRAGILSESFTKESHDAA